MQPPAHSAPVELELELFGVSGIWANAADDIWLVGGLWHPSPDSAVVHYDGVTCFVQESAEEAWMIGRSQVWRLEPL